MTPNKASHLVACMLCLLVAQACTTERPLDGKWQGQYQTTKSGDCGDHAMEISIVNKTVRGIVDVNEPIGSAHIIGTIDSQGKTIFRAEISLFIFTFGPTEEDPTEGDPTEGYEKRVYSFEGWFQDEQGSRTTHPSEAGSRGSLKGVWQKSGKTLAGETHISCAGIWEATQL